MTRLEIWLLHISTLLLTATGAAYAVMRYLMKPTDPFSVLNHPWEPYMIKAHILFAPLLVFAVGAIIHVHVLAKLQNGKRVARSNGLLLLPLFGVMVLSGYLLQAVTEELRTVLVVVHLASGVSWFATLVAHQVAAVRLRASVTKRARVVNESSSGGAVEPLNTTSAPSA
ncbi:MAG: hypothetical protein HYX75_09885 [Acidobacteria bacterium]|nr:hypothetical protein [Acidobacteriota bacterium]